MKCLWLTRKYPRPANSGELIYSNGLIRSFAGAGGDLTVIAHDNDEVPVGNGSEASHHIDSEGVEWRLGSPGLGSRAMSLFTRYPADSWRLKNGGPEKALIEALANEAWDAVIIDHAALGWALGPIRERRRTTGINGDPSLVEEIIVMIDDFGRLNEMQLTSLEICSGAFRWKDRGARLLEAIRRQREETSAGSHHRVAGRVSDRSGISSCLSR